MSGSGRKWTEQPKSDFKWTDDEAELLLNGTHNYNVLVISENVDWESGKSKYDDILTDLNKQRVTCKR